MPSRQRLAAFAAAATVALLGLVAPAARAADTRCYEIRIYHSPPGKLDDLHQRFRNHTLDLFEKHGIRNLGYWVPIQNNSEDPRLIYLVSYPSREAREASWKAFLADPAWQAAHKASEVNGTLVSKIETMFLTATDYSPEIQTGTTKARRVFELRDYTATPGNLGHLNSRFRDHTLGLFAKHGIQNWGYWNPSTGEPGADNRLVYIVTHASTDAAKASFAAFGKDPRWKSAREASEKAGGGSLTAPGGVKSTFLVATDYSPTR
ncbi:MAG: NIPSNAP family protein [Limisphaerales bacterium]